MTYLYVQVQGAAAPVVVRAAPENPLVPGQTAHMALPASRCYLFDTEGRALPRTAAG